MIDPKTITSQSLKGLFSAFLVLSCVPAFQARAGDYEVAHAINARGETEGGKSIECTYKDPCRLKFEKSHISITIRASLRGSSNPFHTEWHEFDVSIRGYGPCCYFADGDDSAVIKDDRKVHRLPIFEGRRRQRNEYVMNRRIGELFLAFWSLASVPQTGRLRPQPTRW